MLLSKLESLSLQDQVSFQDLMNCSLHTRWAEISRKRRYLTIWSYSNSEILSGMCNIYTLSDNFSTRFTKRWLHIKVKCIILALSRHVLVSESQVILQITSEAWTDLLIRKVFWRRQLFMEQIQYEIFWSFSFLVFPVWLDESFYFLAL